MKSLAFMVGVQNLPDHAKTYRVQGLVCAEATRALREVRQNYGDQVDVICVTLTGDHRIDGEVISVFMEKVRPA